MKVWRELPARELHNWMTVALGPGKPRRIADMHRLSHEQIRFTLESDETRRRSIMTIHEETPVLAHVEE